LTGIVWRSTTLLPRLIQRTAANGEDSVEYEYEYRDAEYETPSLLALISRCVRKSDEQTITARVADWAKTTIHVT
jgi:hypothetical protein